MKKRIVLKQFTITIFIIISLGLLLTSQGYSQHLSLKQITFSDSTHDGYPYWSPDSKYIIYSSGSGRYCTTFKIPSKGGTPQLMTEYFSQHAQYSPDGKYLIFDGEVGTRVFLSSADGGNPIRVVPDNILVKLSGMPCWAPDSKTIAFHSFGLLYTVDLSTAEFKKIFSLEGKKILPYDWTNDGSYIYGSAFDTTTRNYDLWKIAADGKDVKQLTFFEGRQTKPSLSPDDSLIVFSSNHGGNTDLWIMPSNGGKTVQITFFPGDENNPGFDVEPSWSPDGKKIAFSSTRTGYWAVWVMEIDMEYIKDKLNTN
jgi:Tol biopolymer transport system component